jgi:hypothetical protein
MRVLTTAIAFALAGSTPAFAAMTITSHDLAPGGSIPAAHIHQRCGGQNISPDLSWSGAPAAAKSLVLSVIDLDVKPALWSHWIVVDLPTSAKGLPRAASTLPPGARAVISNFGEAAYAGPCPPKGSGPHRYEFTIWAMPTAKTAVSADQPANELRAKLSAAAIDHASFTSTVTAKP